MFDKHSDVTRFPVVAETGSNSLAASRLGMMQSAFSRRIVRDERRVG